MWMWGGTILKILKLCVGDRLHMKKPHPCGKNEMEILRVGSDVRIRCMGCGRDVTVPRVKLEKSVKAINGVNV